MIVKLRSRGSVTLPDQLREGLDADSLLDAVRREDGVIELRPVAIDPDQRWFWTERWQQMEREADEDYAAGRYTSYDDVESCLAGLEADEA